MNKKKAIFFWVVTSIIAYITTVSIGMNFYLNEQNKQLMRGYTHMQQKLMKHIETYGDLKDDK